MNNKNEKKILWYNLAFMAFSTVWGFGNVINGFSRRPQSDRIMGHPVRTLFCPIRPYGRRTGKYIQKRGRRRQLLDPRDHQPGNGLHGGLDLLGRTHAVYLTEAKFICDRGELGIFP